MKKMTKILSKVLPIVLVGLIIVGNVFGLSTNFEDLNGGSVNGNLETATNKIWGTVLIVLRILAVAAIAFAGIRYMFASASDKADIKKQLIVLVVGAILVFGATFVIDFVVNTTKNLAQDAGLGSK